jgi:WS/DGAT/MGAT family acyltransferase
MVKERLPDLPPFRRRIVEVPFGLYHPMWIEDPDFDLEYHVRRVAVPAPGGFAEIAELTGDIASRPLDRGRPLWEMWVAEGLEHGHVALIAKLHHAAIDGALGVELMSHLFDLEPVAVGLRDDVDPERPDRVPGDLEMLVSSASSMARQPWLMAKAVRNLVRSALRLSQRVRNETVRAAVPLNAPRTSLNGTLTPHRRVAFSTVPLADIKAVKESFGVTINDVVLTVCAGALRRYFDEHGEAPDKPLVAAVPASVRSEDQRGMMGNRVSAMFASLATQLDDPVERLYAAREGMSGAKAVHEDIGGNTLHEWAEVAAPLLFTRGMRLYTRVLEGRHPPIINLVMSNVPGPNFPLYCAGGRIVSLFPLGPIMAGAGLNITVLSYLDQVGFGFMACRETVPDVAQIADAVPDALAELLKAAD